MAEGDVRGVGQNDGGPYGNHAADEDSLPDNGSLLSLSIRTGAQNGSAAKAGKDSTHSGSQAGSDASEVLTEEQRQMQIDKIEETINRTSFFQINRDSLMQTLQLDEPDSPGIDFRLRLRIAGVLKCYEVQIVLFVVVILTFITTTVDADSRANKQETPMWCLVGSGLTVLLFTVEAVARIFVERWNLFKNVAAAADVFLNFILLGLEVLQYLVNLSDIQVLSILRLFRLLRILKVASVYKHLAICKELSRILEMMGSCTRTLFWSSLFLYVSMHIWSTIAVVLLHPLVTELSDEGMWDACSRCRRSFATVMDSNITFFQTIVAGDSWGVMAIPLIERHPWTAFIMCGALFTLEYGLLQLIVCVIVDCFAEFRESDIRQRAIDKRSQELSEKRVLANIFQKIDTDFSGQVSLPELRHGAQVVPEFAQRLRVMDISNSDLQSLFEILDEDGSGELDFSEFIECFFRMMTAETKTAMAFTKSLARLIKNDQERINGRLDALQHLMDRMQEFLGVPPPKEYADGQQNGKHPISPRGANKCKDSPRAAGKAAVSNGRSGGKDHTADSANGVGPASEALPTHVVEAVPKEFQVLKTANAAAPTHFVESEPHGFEACPAMAYPDCRVAIMKDAVKSVKQAFKEAPASETDSPDPAPSPLRRMGSAQYRGPSGGKVTSCPPELLRLNSNIVLPESDLRFDALPHCEPVFPQGRYLQVVAPPAASESRQPPSTCPGKALFNSSEPPPEPSLLSTHVFEPGEGGPSHKHVHFRLDPSDAALNGSKIEVNKSRRCTAYPSQASHREEKVLTHNLDRSSSQPVEHEDNPANVISGTTWTGFEKP